MTPKRVTILRVTILIVAFGLTCAALNWFLRPAWLQSPTSVWLTILAGGAISLIPGPKRRK